MQLTPFGTDGFTVESMPTLFSSCIITFMCLKKYFSRVRKRAAVRKENKKMNFKFHDTVYIKLDGTELSGELILPENQNRWSCSLMQRKQPVQPRNNFVAKELHKKNTGTFLFDLLTEREDQVYANRFDIDLLTGRLIHVTKHVASQNEFSYLSLGYFGASTGAASALKAAAALPEMIQALFQGGRPDLAIPEIAM